MDKQKTDYVPALRFNWLTAFYDLVIRSTMPEERFKTSLINQAGLQDAHRVLDFGIGTATLSLLAKLRAPKAEITGVDVDEKVIAIAKEKIASSHADIKIDRYDGSRLPYPDNHFDRVISSLVFHHLDRQQKEICLREIRRVLKANGELHVADWGKAQNAFMRALFFLVQILDGFGTTRDNVNGLLPAIMTEAGFAGAGETGRFSTVFGTLSLYRARK